MRHCYVLGPLWPIHPSDSWHCGCGDQSHRGRTAYILTLACGHKKIILSIPRAMAHCNYFDCLTHIPTRGPIIRQYGGPRRIPVVDAMMIRLE